MYFNNDTLILSSDICCIILYFKVSLFNNLKANTNNGILQTKLINQIGVLVKSLITIANPVIPPGAIPCGLKNILREKAIKKHPTSRMASS
jgi:hypothetical protein